MKGKLMIAELKDDEGNIVTHLITFWNKKNKKS